MDYLNLFSELKILKEMLLKEINISLEVLNYIQGLYYFLNACTIYRKLWTIPMIVVMLMKIFKIKIT